VIVEESDERGLLLGGVVTLGEESGPPRLPVVLVRNK